MTTARPVLAAALSILIGSSLLHGQSSLGMVPLEVPTAGTPEAGVLAGLPIPQRMTLDTLLFERRLRSNELAACRRDEVQYGMHLRGNLDPSQTMPLRRSLIGVMNRRATLEARLRLVETEIARRGR